MNKRNFARAIVDCLREREIEPTVAAEIARCVGAVYQDDQFDFARYTTKLLHRHRKRPGPKPNVKHHRKIADAAIYARFNARKGNNGKPTQSDKLEAAKLATQRYGLSSKAQDAVYRAAFERKDPSMNALIRRRIKAP